MIDHRRRHQTSPTGLKMVIGIPKLTDLLLTQTIELIGSEEATRQELKVTLPDLDASRQGLLPLRSLP